VPAYVTAPVPVPIFGRPKVSVHTFVDVNSNRYLQSRNMCDTPYLALGNDTVWVPADPV
jgi:hypothetical protein